MSKHVLITGGAGFIGSHLADELLDHGYRVRALDLITTQVHGLERQRPHYLDPEVELIIGDIRDPVVVGCALQGIDAVYHFAAAVGVGQNMYGIAHYTSTNNLGTAVLLEALIKHPVEQLIVASSMSLYGEGLYRAPDGIITDGIQRPPTPLEAGIWEVHDAKGQLLTPVPTPETKTPSLSSIYALSKFDLEQLCLTIGRVYGIPTVALRFFNVFGPRQALSNPYTGVLAIFTSRLLSGKPRLIYEDGYQQRDFVSIANEPNNLLDWDWRLDPKWRIFNEMIGRAAYWAQHCGKKTVLAGMCPTDPHWLALMCERGVMQYIDVMGVHGFPGTWELDWADWPATLSKVREVLDRYGVKSQVWITETGYSTWRHEEHGQLQAFVDAIAAPVDRIYWYSAYDLRPDLSHQEGFHADERHYHFGLKCADGTPKLLFRLAANAGLAALHDVAWLGDSPMPRQKKRCQVLITGGAGFIGANVADRLLTAGHSVLVFDNLSRQGVDRNLRWLLQRHGDRLQVEVADIRDRYALRRAVRSAEQVYHFAAQVAVTTSLTKPALDFEVNACGTFNLLEALRTMHNPPPLVFTSTNKVYGNLCDISLTKNCTRYEPEDLLISRYGINEDCPLNFHSPYGCSKGTADQYILDYARSFSIPMVAFRMSCIYGPHQFGTEDQGWVAHFLIRALTGQPIMLYGDGMQVRDILFIDDLIEALLLAQKHMPKLSGQAFNIGGGPAQAISLLELIELIAELHGENPVIHLADWRPGDQRYYVSDTRKFREATGWAPHVSVRQGLRLLYQWLLESRGPFAVCSAISEVAS